MHEVMRPKVEPIQIVYKTISKAIAHTGEHAVPVLEVPSAVDTLGMPPRADADKNLTVFESLDKIHDEGLRMGAVDSIEITDDGEAIAQVCSTFAASSHTVFAVPYQKGKEYWENQIAKYKEYLIPQGQDIVVGTENGHAKFLPMQLITWVMLKVKSDTSAKGYVMVPVDIYQIAQAQQDGSHQVKIKGLDPSSPDADTTYTLPEEKVKEIYKAIEKHTDLHTNYLKELYNDYVRIEINKYLERENMTLGPKEIVDIANTMALGYFRDKKEDTGMGGGPQSNSTTHVHTTAYPDLDELRRLIVAKVRAEPVRVNDLVSIEECPGYSLELMHKVAKWLVSKPDITDEELVTILGNEPEIDNITDWLRNFRQWTGDRNIDKDAVRKAIVHQARKVGDTMVTIGRLFNQGEAVLGRLTFSPELIFKQVDPYSTIFHGVMDDWVKEKLASIFAGTELTGTGISSFVHHTEPHRFNMRMAEGWTVEVKDNDFVKLNEKLNEFLHDMSNLWVQAHDVWKDWYIHRNEKGKRYDAILRQLQDEPYKLSLDALSIIKRIMPTDQQLRSWLEQETLTEIETKQLMRKLGARESDKLITRAHKHIKEGKLETRAANVGLYQVLGDWEVVNGNVFTQISPERTRDMRDAEGKKAGVEELRFNTGYNIPGVPGFGITYERIPGGGWKLFICPLLSEKALAEIYAGVVIKREKGKK
jgi:hypothetical protein